jgi:hypothetical protein
MWQETCEQAVKAIVTILMYYPRSFDTEKAGCSEATGFVVNAEKGIILTNRVWSLPYVACDIAQELIRISMLLDQDLSVAVVCFTTKKRSVYVKSAVTTFEIVN